MSLVVAIKDNNRIVLGADKQVSTEFNKDHTCTKIWAVPELPGACMGGVGSARANQIIQYSQIIDKNDVDEDNFDTGYVVTKVVPSIVATLKANGMDCELKDAPSVLTCPNTFLLAYKDKAWLIWNDLSVSELDEYLAIGSGADVATGALFATKDENPFERIVTCIDAAAETTLFVDNGVDLLATVNLDSDEDAAKTALGFGEPDPELIEEVKKYIADHEPKATKKSVKLADKKPNK